MVDRKMIETIREATGATEEDIRVMLFECNYDANETTSRLIDSEQPICFAPVAENLRQVEPISRVRRHTCPPGSCFLLIYWQITLQPQFTSVSCRADQVPVRLLLTAIVCCAQIRSPRSRARRTRRRRWVSTSMNIDFLVSLTEKAGTISAAFVLTNRTTATKPGGQKQCNSELLLSKCTTLHLTH